MKIESIMIKNIGGIQALKLSFIDGVNVICGVNGVGKIMILDIIADAFGIHKPYNGEEDKIEIYGEANMPSAKVVVRAHRNPFSRGFYRKEKDEIHRKEKEIENIKRIASCYGNIEEKRNYEQSKYEIAINIGKETYYLTNNTMYGIYKLHQRVKNILYFRIKDDADFSGVFSSNYQQYQCGRISASEMISVKGWFLNRFQSVSAISRWGKHRFTEKIGELTKQEFENYKLATRIFSILDSTVIFKIMIDGEIILKRKEETILFNNLSNSYKNCIYIVWKIIKEIEEKNKDNPICAENFDGIILIAEIELHLHPIWQVKLVQALKYIFPKAQFIITTHSPSVLQTLERKEIIALTSDENGNIYRKELYLNKYGVQGWTLEEISENIMGMPATTSKFYQDTWKKFDKAMNLEDKEKILEQYEILKQMLHPNNILLKLLSIQIAEWKD